MKRRSGLISALAMLMALVTVFFAGCGDSKQPVATVPMGTTAPQTTGQGAVTTLPGGDDVQPPQNGEQEDVTLQGEDIFDGECFDEMLWGYYEEESYEYNGSKKDTEKFRDGMEFISISGVNGDVAALPVSIQLGRYTHFMSAFYYDGEYYEAYTEDGKAMFRKAYMEEVGDLTEEDFEKIEKIFRLNVAEMTMVNADGQIRIGKFAYEIDDDVLELYELDVDKQYNIELSRKPVVEYQFRHDGGKLTLLYENVKRDYMSDGYKETDNGMHAGGYALNEKNQYEDLLGFSAYQDGYGEEISVSVELEDGVIPVDPEMEFDPEDGSFTLSWETVRGKDGEVEDERTIEGTVVPCTSYGFTSYEGMLLFIDGDCYHYLMSETEFRERFYGSYEDSEYLNDNEKAELNETKKNILDALEAAFKAANIKATIDRDTGMVALEASFLFATNSYELSQDGVNYLNAFTDAYASVVFDEEYSDYVSKIIVEGHTDTSGSYSHNLTLSQNRADAVAQQCIGRKGEMADIIEAVGYSYDYPVYNDNGSVNMEKSRRVTFRFVLTVD